MPIYDISIPISEATIVWPGNSPVQIEPLSSVEKGDVATVSKLTFISHMGTHLDAPKHFLKGGAGVDTLDLEVLVGWARVVDTGDADLLTAEVLESLNIPLDTMRVLFKTRNSDLWAKGHDHFHEDYVGISEDGAKWLVGRGVRLVGIDYASVAPYTEPTPCHVVLLEAGVIPVENLDLSQVPPGLYQLVCLPLKIKDCDGSPCRAILVSNIDTGAKSGE